MASDEDTPTVAEQAAADAAEVVRGKRWLRRVVEVAEAVAAARATAPRLPARVITERNAS